MHPISAHDMLRVWERGSSRAHLDRALMLLSAANPEMSWDDLAALPVGRRDGLLLTLRRWAFGDTMVSVADCPACGESLELTFSVDDVQEKSPDTASASPMQAQRMQAHRTETNRMQAEMDGYEIEFRLVTSADIASAMATSDPRTDLLERCIASVTRRGRDVPVSTLPRSVQETIADRMADADPQAAVHTTVVCPDCTHTWRAEFDAASFFWTEIETWAHRTLRQVHRLARAYGWTESDILKLSASRRQLYMRMIQA